LSRREIRVYSVIGLLVGVGTLYFGATGSSDGPAQVSGQPVSLNQFQAEVAAGTIIILISLVALVLSFLVKSKTTQTGTEVSTTQ
jgi:hypothetical protein